MGNQSISDLLLGRTPGDEDNSDQATFAEGRISSFSEAGAMYTVPSWDDGKFIFGPSPYPTGATIEVGFRCLILVPVSDGESVVEPWIIGVWPSG